MGLDPKITDLGDKVRLEWTPDLSKQGYCLYVDGRAVSRTFKPDARSTTFQKPDQAPHRYGVQVMDVVGDLEAVSWPQIGNLLRWKPPALSNPVNFTLTNATKGSLPLGSGRDLHITQTEKITSHNVLLDGWRNVVWIGGEFDLPTGVQNSAYARIFRCTGIVHLEGLKADKLNVHVDAGLGVSTGPSSSQPGAILQVQNCRLSSEDNISVHDDCIQNWDGFPGTGYNGGCRGYRIDRCTFPAAYQATFFGNHSGPIGPDDSWITNTNYTDLPSGPPICFWKTWRKDPWGYTSTFRFENVYLQTFLENHSVIPNRNGGGTTIPAADNPDRGYIDKTDAQGAYLEWKSTSDCQGIIRKHGPPGGIDMCPASVPGIGYVSPGYL